MAQFKMPQLKDLEHIAREAGKITLSYLNRPYDLKEKSGDQGIVTEADLASEKAILSFISSQFPGHAILAEESAPTGPTEKTAETPMWVIDPIDGTTNFSKRNPYYCVSIGFGLSDGQTYEPLLGVVHQPTTGDMHAAEKGKGYFCNGVQQKMPLLKEPKLACVATGFASNKGDKLRAVVESIYAMQNQFLGTRINGAAALDMAHTAIGILQGFYEKSLSPWDLAAGILLMEEAGGTVTNFHGEKMNIHRDRDIVAGSPVLHGILLDTVKKIWG